MHAMKRAQPGVVTSNTIQDKAHWSNLLQVTGALLLGMQLRVFPPRTTHCVHGTCSSQTHTHTPHTDLSSLGRTTRKAGRFPADLSKTESTINAEN